MSTRQLYYGQPINRANPLTRGLACRWTTVPWYASGPRWIDLAKIPTKNHATITAATWDGALGRPGGYGSLKFNATSAFASHTGFNVTDCTYAAWIRVASDTGANQWIIGNRDMGLSVNLQALAFTWWPNVNTTSVSHTFTFALNTWYHVAATQTGTSYAMYINGLNVKAGTTVAISNGATLNRIGAFTTIWWFSGLMDDIQVYDSRALNDSEMYRLYNDTRRGNTDTFSWIEPTDSFGITASSSFPTRQLSQRFDSLPIVESWWDRRSQSLPLTYLPPPPLINPQRNQRFDILPDLWQQYTAATQRPYSQWYVPGSPSTRQLSQQWDALPDWWSEWDSYKQNSYSQWYVPALPPMRQGSQEYNPLLDYWQEWSAYAQPLQAAIYIPPAPKTKQLSQRLDSLPDLNAWWEQFQHWPATIGTSPSPDNPATRQPSQSLYYDLPNWWAEWDQYKQDPYSQWYTPTSPPTRQLGQEYDPIFDYTDYWWQHSVWPIPQGSIAASAVFIISWRGITDLDLVWSGVTNLRLWGSATDTSTSFGVLPLGQLVLGRTSLGGRR